MKKVTVEFEVDEADFAAVTAGILDRAPQDIYTNMVALLQRCLYDEGPMLGGNFRIVYEYPYTVSPIVHPELANEPARIVSSEGEMLTLKFENGANLQTHFTNVKYV